jgi:hypothetical protein
MVITLGLHIMRVYSKKKKNLDRPGVSVSLPMLRVPAHNPAMICHVMNTLASATRCTNPGQIPVVALDQLL